MNFLKFLQNEQRQAETKDDGKGPRALTAQEFDQLIAESQVPVVVDFWAEWCGPCHMLAPSIDQMAREYEDRAVVCKLNGDDYPEILERYGIMGIPTLLYFQGGRVVDRVVGVNPYGALKNRLERLTKA